MNTKRKIDPRLDDVAAEEREKTALARDAVLDALTVRQIEQAGYRGWGAVIPNPRNAPAGSVVRTFRRGRDEISAVIGPRGRVVRISS